MSIVLSNCIPASTERGIALVCQFESEMRKLPQLKVTTWHTIHAGIYTRTILIPAGAGITGALIKVATTLVVNGHCMVFVGEDSREIAGHCVLPAAGLRKQAFVALQDTWLTMMFKTDAKTVEEAEQEFTDDYEILASRLDDAVNEIIITEV